MNILEIIIAQKQREVAEQKQLQSINDFTSASNFNRQCYSLKNTLSVKNSCRIIAEF